MQRFVRCSSGSSPPCSRWPLIDSSASASSPPALPPASRHPAGLPRLVSFSRSGCPHPARASTASTHPSISLGFAQNCCLGRFRERLSAASSACHARPLEACGACFRLDSFAMESIESGDWTSHHAGVCMSRLFLGPLNLNAWAIEARRDGGLASFSKLIVALLHIVQNAYMGSSFLVCFPVCWI